MALKIKNKTPNQPFDVLNEGKDESIVYEYKIVNTGIPNLPKHGIPNTIPKVSHVGLNPVYIPKPPPIKMPEESLKRAVNYYADYGGCGYWRMIWPEILLCAYNKAIVSGSTQMILDPRFYGPVSAIKFQRQCSKIQNDFIDAFYRAKKTNNLKIIYEIDDIIFGDDIPLYNRCREAFQNKENEKFIKETMGKLDEITTTTKFLAEYYKEKTGNSKVRVIPNYPPKFWLDRFYNPEKISENYEKNKKRPRILYAGSGTHLDVSNANGGVDDFTHVVDYIIKTRNDFKWVFKGCYPIKLKPFIDEGVMEYVSWSNLFDLPSDMNKLNCQACYAPLIDNLFNRSKSNIKMIESGGLGIPGVFQDLCTYEDAELKFQTGEDLIDQLKFLTADQTTYMSYSEKARKYVEDRWLEDHLDEHMAVYFSEWSDEIKQETPPKAENQS